MTSTPLLRKKNIIQSTILFTLTLDYGDIMYAHAATMTRKSLKAIYCNAFEPVFLLPNRLHRL